KQRPAPERVGGAGGSGIAGKGNPPRRRRCPLPRIPENSQLESSVTRRPSFVSDNHRSAWDRDTRTEDLAAELTRAAYPRGLRRGLRGRWLEVELGLWRALAQTVEKWARKPPPAPDPDELEAWREGLLVELTVTALAVALKSGIKAPLLKLERGVSTA